MNEQKLLDVLNKAWGLLRENPNYDTFNQTLEAADPVTLDELEAEFPQLGLTPDGALTTLSILATVTDLLCGKRLAARVEDDGSISGWVWWRADRPALLPRKGAIAFCSIGKLGLITSDGPHEITYSDGNKGLSWTGIQLTNKHPDTPVGSPWASRTPHVVGYIDDIQP